MKKRISVFALCLLLVAGLLVGCAKKEEAAAPATGGAASGIKATAAEPPKIAGALAGTPIILTSVGQSADVNVVQTLLKKCGIESDLDAVVKAQEVSKKYKTLILAIGGSSKGLGAAGIDENQEMERVKAVIGQAKAEGLKIVSLHIGGSARRGTLSDKFIPEALKVADAAIIVSEGDADGFMKGILAANNIPTAVVDNQVGAIEPLKTIFGK